MPSAYKHTNLLFVLAALASLRSPRLAHPAPRYVIQLFTPLNFLGSVYNMLVMAMIDLKNLSQLLSESHDIEDVPGAVNIPPIARSASGPVVTFNNIRFHYPSQPPNSGLQDLSLEMKAGTTTAIVGPTGAGKTTISR